MHAMMNVSILLCIAIAIGEEGGKHAAQGTSLDA